MNKFIICVFAFLCLSKVALAQSSVDEYYNLAEEAASNRDCLQAIPLYGKVIALDDSYLAAYYNRALCLCQTESYEEALNDAHKTIELAPYDAANYSLRGMIYARLENYQAAIADYEKGLTLESQNKTILTNLGVAQEKLRLYKEAYANYQKVLLIDSNSKIALSGVERLKDLFEVLEKEENKEKSYNVQPAQSGHFTAKDYMDIADAASSEGAEEVAIEYYTRAIEKNPDYADAYSRRGVLKRNRREYHEALTDFTRFLTLRPTSKWTFNMRGQVHVELKRYEDAIADFKKALSIDPDYSTAKINLEALYTRLGKGIDNTAPKVIITYPTSENRGLEVVKYDEVVTVTGRAEDESGIEKVYINGMLANLNYATGEFYANTKLTLGKNTLIVTAFDTKGNKGERTFIIDRKSVEATSNAVNNNALPMSKNENLLKLIGTNYALIITTNEYDEWGNLQNPILDGQAITKLLTEVYGFSADVLLNATHKDMMQKIREYTTKTYQPNDQLFIFVAGHGDFDMTFKEGYIVPKDAKVNDEIRTKYISQTQFRKYVDNIPCKHIFVVLDVCFGGTLDPVVKLRGNSNVISENVLANIITKKTRRYLTSVGKDYASDGVPGKHSPFANDLLEALRSGGGDDKVLTVDEILKYVKKQETTIEGLEKSPCYGKFGEEDAGSDFVFISR